MSAHAEPHEHFAGSNKLFISIWIWLLALTGFEVFLGYIQLPIVYMLESGDVLTNATGQVDALATFTNEKPRLR